MGLAGRWRTVAAVVAAAALAAGLVLVRWAGRSDEPASFHPIRHGRSAGPAAAGPGAPATVLSASFDAGNTLELSDTEGPVRVTRAAAHGRGYGLDIRTRDQPGYASWTDAAVGLGHAYWSIRAWVRVVSFAGRPAVDLLTVQNTRTAHNFDFFLDSATGRFRWDLYSADSATGDRDVVLGRWYLVQASGHFGAGGSYTAAVSIDGVRQPSIRSVRQPAATVRQVLFGQASEPKTNEKTYDGLVFEAGDHPLGPTGPAATGR